MDVSGHFLQDIQVIALPNQGYSDENHVNKVMLRFSNLESSIPYEFVLQGHYFEALDGEQLPNKYWEQVERALSKLHMKPMDK
jgi:hypothetical protein